VNLSVVVSAYSLDRYHDLTEVLDGLNKQTYDSFEKVVVIDKNKELFNNISDYIKINGINNVKTIFNPENRGLSYSRNLGIENSTGSIIAFIDDDAIPSRNWAKSIIETFEEDKFIGAVTGDIFPLWEYEDLSWFPKELHWMISCSYVMTPNTKQNFDRGFGTNMAFKREVFLKAGNFDTTFGINGKKWVGGEDTEMFLRVNKLGMKIIFNPEIYVQHKVYRHRVEIRNVIKRAFNGGYSVSLMKKKLNYTVLDSKENRYFKHILLKFYPSKFKEFILKPSVILLRQIFAVSIVLFFELAGYMYGAFGYKT
jgi:GT2 family glycosyltransferase